MLQYHAIALYEMLHTIHYTKQLLHLRQGNPLESAWQLGSQELAFSYELMLPTLTMSVLSSSVRLSCWSTRFHHWNSVISIFSKTIQLLSHFSSHRYAAKGLPSAGQGLLLVWLLQQGGWVLYSLRSGLRTSVHNYEEPHLTMPG